MQDQIQEILRKEDITSSQFADTIGVQRSSVSHVLSGRNKPGFDFIRKILEAYPDISADWLINGKGEMYRAKVLPGSLFEGPYSETSPGREEKPLRPAVESTGMKSTEEKERRPESTVKEREIERIMVFYKDKTFEEFKPGSPPG